MIIMDVKLESLVFKNYKRLNDNDKYIWNYILNNKDKCETMSIHDLAGKCNVSHTTILRFAKKIGLNGYSELKFYLKMENKHTYAFDRKKIYNMLDDINKTADIMINKDFSGVFRLIDKCGRIYAYGTGRVQLNAIKELKRVFFTVGKLFNVIEGIEELKLISKHITSDDIVFLVSLSGENNLVNDIVKKLKNKYVSTICITSSGKNTLSKLCDFSIQFYCNDVVKLENEVKIFPLSQFFIVNELLLIKYLEYKYGD